LWLKKRDRPYTVTEKYNLKYEDRTMAIETIRLGQWELDLEVTQAFGGGYNARLGSIK